MPRLRSLSRDRKSKSPASPKTASPKSVTSATPSIMTAHSVSTPKRKGSKKTLSSPQNATIASRSPVSTPKRKGSRKNSTSKLAADSTPRGSMATTSPSVARTTNQSTAGDSTAEEVTHIIRVTVLGLAGITVDKSKCLPANQPKPNLPAPPSKMKAVVAFSRGSDIHGTTALSRPLVMSPTESVIPGDSSARLMRHVAVWSSEDKTLGSTVSFEANLRRAESTNATTTASSPFTPKSFELTVALTEENGEENKIALPCGVSSLAVSGDECRNGQVATVDLPILSIAQARPLSSNKNGLGGYPMIAITPKVNEAGVEDQLKKKRNVGLQRLFKRGGSDSKFPSVIARRFFASAYSMDASGDAVLRVSLEVYEKGSDLEATFLERRLLAIEEQCESKGLSPPASTRKTMSLKAMHNGTLTSLDEPRSENKPDETCESPGIEVPLEASVELSIPPSVEQQPTEEKEVVLEPVKPDATNLSTDLTSTVVAETDATGAAMGEVALTAEESSPNKNEPACKGDLDYKDKNDGKESDEDSSQYSSIVTKEDNNVAYFQWTASTSMRGLTVDENYTLSFGEKTEEAEREMEPRISLQDDDNIAIKILGRDIKVPTCGLRLVFDHEGDDRSLLSEDGTLFTAKLFGRQYQIPVPKVRRADGGTVRVGTDGAEPRRAKLGEIFGMMCRRRPKQSEMEMNMFTTFSEDEDFTEGSRTQGSYTYADTYAETHDNTYDDTNADTYTEEPRPWSQEAMAWLTNESLNPKEQEDRKLETSKTASSPSGVLNFPVIDKDFKDDEPARDSKNAEIPQDAPAVGRTLADIFACRYSFANELSPRYEPYREEIPPVIIPADNDELSVGDLTATTHEMQVAAEARHQKRIASKAAASNGVMGFTNILNPLPKALGGNGLFSIGQQTTSGPISVQSNDSASIRDSHQGGENYFAEYEYTSDWNPSLTSLQAKPAASEDGVEMALAT